MNSQIDIYDSHMGSEQRQIHWISGAALFAAQKNSRNNIKIYDVGTPQNRHCKNIVMHFPYANIFFSEWEFMNARAVKKRQIIQIRVLLTSIWEFTNSTTR